MTREEAVALLERYSNYEGLGIPNLAGCKEAMKVAAEALKEAYPELAESEDERIRKRLIEYFEGFRMGNAEVKWEGLNVQEVLVWLEKQKEQKHPNGCFTCDEYKKGYEEGRRNGFTAGYNKAMKEVEQKEQKPVVTHGETYHVDTLGTQQVIAGKMPQKPAEWDKEDKEMFEAVDESLYCYESGKAPEMVAQIEAERCWLHSLPERFNLQPKQEWSEEEKEMLRTVIYDLERHDKDAYAAEIKWLKSLLERFTLPIKQEWDEFDEDCLKRAIWYVENPAPSVVKDTNLALWLKSLPERKNLPPKQEWNKEDENKIIFLERLIEHNVPDGQYGRVDGMKGGFVTKAEAISMLKFLRPQYHGDVTMTEAYKMGKEAGEASHWKPNEEQMEALNDTINILAASPFLHQNDYLFNILNGLREELKKLL